MFASVIYLEKRVYQHEEADIFRCHMVGVSDNVAWRREGQPGRGGH
jgi:hypothetical protein